MRERLIGTVLLGNNVVNIAASALATSVLLRIFGDAGVLYATIGMTLLVLIFGEVLPKTYAIINADRVALLVAPVVRLLVTRLQPHRHDGRICGQAHPAPVRRRHQQGKPGAFRPRRVAWRHRAPSSRRKRGGKIFAICWAAFSTCRI